MGVEHVDHITRAKINQDLGKLDDEDLKLINMHAAILRSIAEYDELRERRKKINLVSIAKKNGVSNSTVSSMRSFSRGLLRVPR